MSEFTYLRKIPLEWVIAVLTLFANFLSPDALRWTPSEPILDCQDLLWEKRLWIQNLIRSAKSLIAMTNSSASFNSDPDIVLCQWQIIRKILSASSGSTNWAPNYYVIQFVYTGQSILCQRNYVHCQPIWVNQTAGQIISPYVHEKNIRFINKDLRY